jgi:hypothetical protein
LCAAACKGSKKFVVVLSLLVLFMVVEIIG